MLSLFRARRVGLAFLASITIGASSATAQCVGADNLDVGTCCGPATPVLPTFGAVAMLPGRAVCWDRCTPGITQNLVVSWSPPTATNCSQFTSILTVSTGPGLPLLTGPMEMNYTRTWRETDTLGLCTRCGGSW